MREINLQKVRDILQALLKASVKKRYIGELIVGKETTKSNYYQCVDRFLAGGDLQVSALNRIIKALKIDLFDIVE